MEGRRLGTVDYVTIKSLRDHLESSVTGRLTVGKGRRAVSVYLMNGTLIGAETPDESRRLLRRLSAERTLDPARLGELRASIDEGDSVIGVLFEEVDGELMERLLLDRFEDALTEWVACDITPEFTPMPAVFIENLQMGVDVDAVLESACQCLEEARDLSLDLQLVAGRGLPKGKLELAVRALLGHDMSVGDLLDVLPVEPWKGRALIASMLSRGGLRTEKTEPEVAWEYEEKIERAAAISDQFEDQDPEDGSARTAETVVVDPYEAARAEALALQPGAVVIPEVSPDDETEQVELPPDDLDTFEQSPTEPPTETEAESVRPSSTGESGFDEQQRAVGLHSPTQTNPLSGLEYMEVEGDFMDAFEEESLGYGKVPMPEAPQASVAFDSGAEEDAEVISAFNDANEYRGGSKTAGHFVTETHNLDIVSLDGASLDLDLGGDDEDEEMEIEADEVPAQSFGAPRLSEEDAQHKIDVANSVLEVIAVEYDKASGQGAGRAAVQLLLSGCPKKYAPLFSDVTADKQGRIIHHEVLRNLYARPASEHRLLLSQGVKDLLDRGMSVAAEELPDDGIDAVLEASAGLRQRLGL